MAPVAIKRSSIIEGTDGSRYQVIDMIGEGSYGKVFAATDLGNEQTVAIKTIQDCDRQAFLVESQIYQKLSERQAALTAKRT